ncbi:DUF418 domain-containing protein [Stappia stellulata]|uniref:DUF418 domain-containing protein n=1 Tax=Stappia stellulata TaxID=71235 RepID=UPI00040432C0|nr:DUF418 domain-containing protein [Stappia stellulata]
MDQSIRSAVPGVAHPSPTGRLAVLDALRGFAALGILWRNIFVFGMPAVAFSLPEEWGLATDANVASWLFVVIFVDGTMRGLFSLLFGASAILIMEKYSERPGGLAAADLYFRRLMWLIVFGLVHGYLLLWPHDVLYVYGVIGMFLFVFRNLSGRWLLVIALAIFAVSSFKDGTGWSLAEESMNALDAKQMMEAKERAVGGAQDTGPGASEAVEDSMAESASGMDQAMLEDVERFALYEIEEHLQGYVGLLHSMASQTFLEQTTIFVSDHLLDVGAMMFFGMALFRLGGLSGAWSFRAYLALAVGGLGVGVLLGLGIHGATTLAVLEAYSVGTADAYLYNARRLALCLGLIGLFHVLWRVRATAGVIRVLSVVGRMPLSVYVSQTIICVAVFYGVGFAQFGTLEHYELLLVALVINAVQIGVALLWLRRWRQGPLEALLRYLVEGKPRVG